MLQQLSLLPIEVLTSIGLFMGLLIGSFLNVVIYRFPNMMMHAWTVQSREWLELDSDATVTPPHTL